HRMRAFDRDLIRGGHYGQRSCEPRSKAEHMAAPTKLCDVKILLANPEPSTHGTFPTCPGRSGTSVLGGLTDVQCAHDDDRLRLPPAPPPRNGKAEKRNQLATTSAEPTGRAPLHSRTRRRSTTTAALPALPKIDLRGTTA